MIYLRLLLTFIKIGLFSFGGGYAMIPLIQKEIETNGWVSNSEFVDIIAISEITPGPISVNSATFVGYKAAGIFGGTAATIGVALPSIILVIIISRYFFKFQNHPVKMAVFYGIRPVVTALVLTAAVFVAETSLFKIPFSNNMLKELFTNPLGVIDIRSIAVLSATMIATIKFKIHPIFVITGSAVLGVLLF